jgi:EF-P beta-lysylation protein EpmB
MTPGVSEAGKLAATPKTSTWRAALAEAIRDVDELARVLRLPAAPSLAAASAFPLLVPRRFAALMTPGDPFDPLLLQVLPQGRELDVVPGFTTDPVAEDGCAAVPGLLRKYAGRALLVATGACAIHCRYCFRRHFPYAELPRGADWWRPALTAVAADATIEELILSGGDALTLPDTQLAAIAHAAAAIPHLRRLRVHSRVPVVLPERVDAGFLGWFCGTRLEPVLVIHANHPREMAPDLAAACRRARAAGATVLNQAVLLAGVNDDVAVLAALSRALHAAGVLPYYLHALDPVAGAAHFAVDDARGAALLRDLAAELPGYLLPRLVREVPGAPGKTPLRD